MAQQIYRYVVPVDDQPHTIELHPAHCADIGPLHLAASLTAVEFWAAHEDDQPPLPFTFQVFGTGQPVPPSARWSGTAPRTREGLVWHLFQLQDTVEEPSVAVIRGETYTARDTRGRVEGRAALMAQPEVPVVDQEVIDRATPEVSTLANSLGYALAGRGVQITADDTIAAAQRVIDQGWARGDDAG